MGKNCTRATLSAYRMALCREGGKASLLKHTVLALTAARAAEDRALVYGLPTGEIHENIAALEWLLLNMPEDE